MVVLSFCVCNERQRGYLNKRDGERHLGAKCEYGKSTKISGVLDFFWPHFYFLFDLDDS